MSKSDVKMEDAEKHFHDSRNNVQESESKALDAKIEGKGESVVSAATASEDENKRDNGGEDVNKSRNEDKDKAEVNTEVKDLTNPKNEGNEQIEGSIHEQTNAKSEHGKLFNTKTEDDEQPAPLSAVEEQIDAKNEVLQRNSTNGVDTEMKFIENSVDGGNHVKNVEEKPSVGVELKGLKAIGKENTDCVEHLAGDKKTIEKVNAMDDPSQYRQLPTELSANNTPNKQNAEMDEVPKGVVEEIVDAAKDGDKTVKDDLKEHSGEAVVTNRETAENAKTVETASKHEGEDSSFLSEHEAATPNALVRHSPAKAGDRSGETVKSVFAQATPPQMGENDDGTPEEQTAFMKEIESFYRERAMDFKPPKFYGQPLNCLKLWRAVIRLGGYDRVTGSKLWRQVGESFHPPKTCTTVSWTFRIFYEKSLLEYERHKTQTGELQLPAAMLPEASGVDTEGNGYQGSGSGRARRDAAARAMQGWHVQRLSDYGEVGEPIIKDKNLSNVAKREKNLKSIGSLKQKRPSEVEHSIKAARTETSKQLATSIVDVGPPADWVKINVRQTKDCFEVYALVPGLLREEVRVQSDPAGRVVITGQPEQVDNPWGITPFKKVISLPARINPLQTSAVVSLHGRLFVRVPFEQASM